MISKHRAEDEAENEITAVYVGEAEEVNLNNEIFETGKFLTIAEIKKLARQKNATPYINVALKFYQKYARIK